MNDISSELLRLGIVSKEAVEQKQKRERIQSERRNKKVHLKIGLNPRNRFASVKEFLEDLPRRLKSSADMKDTFRDAHWLADDLALARDKRNRLHSFLCRIAEKIDNHGFTEFLDKEIRKY